MEDLQETINSATKKMKSAGLDFVTIWRTGNSYGFNFDRKEIGYTETEYGVTRTVVDVIYNTPEKSKNLITFYNKTSRIGNRFEFSRDKDIFQTAEYFGYDVYPIDGEDFDKGVKDWNGGEIMDSQDYATFLETGIGSFDFGGSRIYSKELKNIKEDEFAILDLDLQLQYINLYYPSVTIDTLKLALKEQDAWRIFNYEESDWASVLVC